MLHKRQEIEHYKRNIKNYITISYLNAAILIWGVMTLYYAFKGLSFLEISLLQSIGSIITIILEIPSGWVSDRYGHSFILKVSAICRVIAIFFLIISNKFCLFLIAEIFSSIAISSQSGADTALFYNSLTKTGQQEEYSIIKAKIRGRQSLIRIASRLAAPLFFSIFAELPFICSGIIYFIITVLTIGYITPVQKVSENKRTNNKEVCKNKKAKPDFAKVRVYIIHNLSRYKLFIAYSLLSAFVLVSVSNYSQFISPFLVERGLDIKWLGVVLAMASIGDYVGTKLVSRFKNINRSYLLLLLAIIISGFVMWGGMKETILGGAIGYFGINMVYSPFVILLEETLNKVIENKYRATLLSIGNQVDELFGIVADPIIGRAIDISGFRVVYIWMSIISIIMLFIISILITKGRIKK